MMEKGFALALVVLCAVLRSSKFQHNKRAALQSPRSWDAVSGPLTHASRTRTKRPAAVVQASGPRVTDQQTAAQGHQAAEVK